MDALRILVTDDEPGMRAGVERALRGFAAAVPDVGTEVSFVVECTETGEDALERIRRDPPDILLLDHKLPGISGLDVLDAINDMKLDMLTVMITAYASIETAIIATKRGAYDFLAKPFTPEELKSTIRKAAARIVLAKQARKLAEEKRQVRFQFISVLAHELKAPLGAVEGYLNILKDRSMRGDPEKVDHMIQRSLARTEGMRKLIYDLLDLTRIESGVKTRTFSETDIVEVASVAIETARPAADERSITIDLHADAPVTLAADRSEIEIIMNNLVSNAVKYNRDGGRVDVTLDADDDGITIVVADTGIGMTPEESAKLFHDFVRIKNDKTRSIMGSGLGLSTVKKLAQLYHGDARVESEPDVGTTFTVRLGRQTNPQVEGAAVDASAEPASIA